MNKNIMILNGSPRKNGNTATLIDWVSSGFKKESAAVELIDATRLINKSNGCLGCRKCNDSDDYNCVVQDETSFVIRQMLEKDVVVFATPVYFGGFTAQLKQLIDRMYCLKRYTQGRFIIHPALKKVSFVLLATSGADENAGLNFMFKHMQGIAAGFEKEIRALLIPGCPADPGEMISRSEVREKAMLFGEQIAGGYRTD